MPPGASRMAERPSISTHVLDTDRGAPARGVRVELYRQGRLLSDQQTNDDGRIADLVQGTLEAGGNRMVFTCPRPFFCGLEARFKLATPGRPFTIRRTLPPIFAPHIVCPVS